MCSYRDVPTQHQYSDEEYARIDAAVLNEGRQIRGGDVRYWEDVTEGEAPPAIARGPLSLMDTMGFLVGCGRGHTHGVVLKSAMRHPKDGYALVDIDIVGENQRGELTTKGLATVHLFSRNLNHRVALTGADINLELPTVR